MDFARFGEIPVAHLGRIKPLDTLARNTLRALTINSESAKTADGKRIPATRRFFIFVAGEAHPLATATVTKKRPPTGVSGPH